MVISMDQEQAVTEEKGLRRLKRTRLIAAGVTLALTLWCIWWLYDAEFHYPNTEAGRLAAVEDYIAEPEDSTMSHDLKAGTPFRAIAWQEARGKLFIFYGADNRDNVHGIIELTQGINGKYRTDQASMDPFPYTAGVMVCGVDGRHQDLNLIAIAGDNCREIHSVAVGYTYNIGQPQSQTGELIYPVAEANFLWLLDKEEVKKQLGASEGEIWRDDVRFLDRDGNDVTEQCRDAGVRQSWSGTRSSAEQELLYVYIGLAAAAGAAVILYFLRKS